MSSSQSLTVSSFVDRRDASRASFGASSERRQFSNSHAELSPDAQVLAAAIDQYKLRRHRRFINYEELLGVVKSLGYTRAPGAIGD